MAQMWQDAMAVQAAQAAKPDQVPMPYTLAFRNQPVPGIPPAPVHGSTEGHRPEQQHPDQHEHFGTREAAMGRVVEMLPAPSWLNLRLFGPDGRHIANQAALERLVAGSR